MHVSFIHTPAHTHTHTHSHTHTRARRDNTKPSVRYFVRYFARITELQFTGGERRVGRAGRKGERRRKGETREIENTRALPACSRLSNILLGRARLEIELCPLIEMINCLTSAAPGAPRRATPRRAAPRRGLPDCLFTNRKYENVRNRASDESRRRKVERERPMTPLSLSPSLPQRERAMVIHTRAHKRHVGRESARSLSLYLSLIPSRLVPLPLRPCRQYCRILRICCFPRRPN